MRRSAARLIQDIPTLRPEARAHVDPVLYDELAHRHPLRTRQPARATYADAVDPLSTASIIRRSTGSAATCSSRRAARKTASSRPSAPPGSLFVAGVQWHPEFHWRRNDRLDPEPLMNALPASGAQPRRRRDELRRRHLVERAAAGPAGHERAAGLRRVARVRHARGPARRARALAADDHRLHGDRPDRRPERRRAPFTRGARRREGAGRHRARADPLPARRHAAPVDRAAQPRARRHEPGRRRRDLRGDPRR